MTLAAWHLLLCGGWIIALTAQERLRRSNAGADREVALQSQWTLIKRLELPLLIAVLFASVKLRLTGPDEVLLRLVLASALLAVFASLYRFWLVRLALRMASHGAWDLFAMIARRQVHVMGVIGLALAAACALGLFRLL